jgi:hypothetical protein
MKKDNFRLVSIEEEQESFANMKKSKWKETQTKKPRFRSKERSHAES